MVMSVPTVRVACNFCKNIKPCLNASDLLLTKAIPVLSCIQARHVTNKHYDRKWRAHRAAKFLKFPLPDFDRTRREDNMEPSEMRAEMKKKGLLPPRNFQERGIVLSATSDVFEPYVPPEGDGVASMVSTEGAKQRLTGLEKKGKSFMQMRKIRQFDEDFDASDFAETAQEIYIKTHDMLQDLEKNEEDLHDLVSEKAFPEMVWKLEKKTFRWKFMGSLEPPRVVHVRTTDLLSKDNVYGQVTVRFHTQQTLAIYDRFGRLAYGSENLVKDCLEYVVYEKHLSDEYGQWRIHAKIIPDWMPPRQPVVRTLRKPKFDPIPDEVEEEKKTTEVATATPDQPAMATA